MRVAIFYLSWQDGVDRQPIQVGAFEHAYVRVAWIEAVDLVDALGQATPRSDETVMNAHAPRVIGALRRGATELETLSICPAHGAFQPDDVRLDELSAQDGDLLVDGVHCDLCQAPIIAPDATVAALARAREAGPVEARPTSPRWS